MTFTQWLSLDGLSPSDLTEQELEEARSWYYQQNDLAEGELDALDLQIARDQREAEKYWQSLAQDDGGEA